MSETSPVFSDVGAENRVSRLLTRFLDGCASVTLFSLMVMTCIDVIGRYFFKSPLDGATELTRLMMAGVIFSALPTVSFREQHIAVDLLDFVYPKKWVGLRQAFITLISAIAMAVISWRVWILADRSRSYGDVTEYLEIPIYPVTFFISVMSALTALALAVNVVRYLMNRGPLND